MASAEQFADLIDESQTDELDLGGSEAVSNVKDKAGIKQLKWEKVRNEKMSGKDYRGKKKAFGKGGGKKTNFKKGKKR